MAGAKLTGSCVSRHVVQTDHCGRAVYTLQLSQRECVVAGKQQPGNFTLTE